MIDMVKVKINGEYEIILPKHRADRPEWYTPEGWEKNRLASMHDNIHTGDILYYVGAEEGEMPALCQMWGAQVFLFEPNPKAWPNIRAIWKANDLHMPAAIIPGFASDVDRETSTPVYDNIITRDGWPKSAHDEIVGDHGFKELYLEADNFHQVRIDTVAQASSAPPTALSIDVEGAEGLVLKGAEQTLRKHHPKIWLSAHPEFMHEHYKMDLRTLRTWLKKDIGYFERILDYDHELHLLYV